MAKRAWLYAGLLALTLGGCTAFDGPTLQTIELEAAPASIKAGESANIKVTSVPADLPIGWDSFKWSGGELALGKDGLTFTAREKGNYTIQASQDGIQSNIITIQVGEGETQNKEVLSVDTILMAPGNQTGTTITVQGFLGSPLTDSYGNYIVPLWNEARSAYLPLAGILPETNGYDVQVTGTLHYTGLYYYLEADSVLNI